MTNENDQVTEKRSFIERALNTIEKIGNKLPDPAALFLILLFTVWILSWLLSNMTFAEIDPRNGKALIINNQLSGTAIANFLSTMVKTFTDFHPLGIVLVALLGVGVAEHTGFINASLKWLLGFTSKSLLTPMLVFIGIISNLAADAGYVLVIPLGAAIFYSAGRHPLAGIAATFAGVSGGFSANFIPSSLDPLISGITQSAVQVIDPSRTVNPLSSWFFMAASTLIITAIGWYVTDKIIEPRLKSVEIDGNEDEMPKMEELGKNEKRGLAAAFIALFIGLAILAAASIPENSPMRSPAGYKLTKESFEKLNTAGIPGDVLKKIEPIKNKEFSKTAFDNEIKGKLGEEGSKLYLTGIIENVEQNPPQLTSSNAPLMLAIVPLIFILFLIPGVVYGYFAKSISGHRDIISGMSKSMSTMGYYIVLAFFASLFIAAFAQSNIGALLAIKGANFLRDLGLPGQVTIIGIIILSGLVNLLIGSASAKWALLAPIFVPMLMQLGISPELSQTAYRIGDSCTNILTPLMPYFPLVVVFSQKYVKSTGIGTIVSLMLPYSITFLIFWSIFLVVYWMLGIPLGIQATYTYP